VERRMRWLRARPRQARKLLQAAPVKAADCTYGALVAAPLPLIVGVLSEAR
jgi:hypothetical protein